MCDPFSMKGEKEVSAKLAAVEDLVKQEHHVGLHSLQPSGDEEYKKIVRTLLFLISAKPSPTPCLLQKEVYTKIVGEKGLRGKRTRSVKEASPP